VTRAHHAPPHFVHQTLEPVGPFISLKLFPIPVSATRPCNSCAQALGRHPEGLHVFAMLCRGVSAAKRASSAVVASSRCMASAAGLRQTLVHDEHVEAGATMVSVIEWLVCVLHLCSHCNGADRVQLRAPALLQWHCRVHVCTTHRPHCTHYSRSNLSARTVACCFLVAKLNPLLSKSSRLCTAQHFSCAAPTAVDLAPSLTLSSYTPTH
jgi:hypothetical protein